MNFWIGLLVSLALRAEDTVKKLEIPFDPPKMIFKVKHPVLGNLEITCRQRLSSPDQELIFSYTTGNDKRKNSNDLLQLKTFNNCAAYKFKLSKDLHLRMISAPGGRNDEPGSLLTTVYNWRAQDRRFEEVSRKIYSPFKSFQTEYRKLLEKASLPKAEKLVVANRKKIEAYTNIQIADVQSICEDFHAAYKNYADKLYKEKNYSLSFAMYFSMKQKFGDPQNIFYDAKSKNKPIVLVCQTENSNTDQSEDRFYTFARRYLNKVEFVPFMLKQARKNIQEETLASKEIAVQILKYVSFLLRSSASQTYQLEYQPQVISAWNLLIQNNLDHPDYNRLIEEDNHLIFLLAENHSCAGIPIAVLKRITLNNDGEESLNAMTISAGDDYFDENLEQSGIYEYKQFVQGRALLKKCEQIPKKVFERYFKFSKEQPYQN